MEKGDIIGKIFKGETIGHSKELADWISESEENRNEYIRYKNLWALIQEGKEIEDEDLRKDFLKIKSHTGKPVKSVFSRNLLKYAAIIIFAFTGGFFIHSYQQNSGKTLNEVLVPHGNRSLIHLSDGSKIWLTNGSKLTYPEKFTGKTRNVSLEGEAYFIVAHQPDKPFFVDLGKQRIKVLGTEFSVISYPEDSHISVDLVTGKVQMDVAESSMGRYKSYYLKPLHRLILDKTSGMVQQYEIPDGFFNYWKSGTYEFKDESFASLAQKIERIYGVRIIFRDKEIQHRTFTGTFKIDDNIYTLLEVFRRASGKPFEFDIKRDQIFIQSAKNNMPM